MQAEAVEAGEAVESCGCRRRLLMFWDCDRLKALWIESNVKDVRALEQTQPQKTTNNAL